MEDGSWKIGRARILYMLPNSEYEFKYSTMNGKLDGKLASYSIDTRVERVWTVHEFMMRMRMRIDRPPKFHLQKSCGSTLWVSRVWRSISRWFTCSAHDWNWPCANCLSLVVATAPLTAFCGLTGLSKLTSCTDRKRASHLALAVWIDYKDTGVELYSQALCCLS